MSSPDELTQGEKNKLTRLRGFLLGWYAEHGRDLPWRREEASNFEKICVEVLLQRTQAKAVASVYPHFFGRFRSWDDLAEATIEELEKQLKPIGPSGLEAAKSAKIWNICERIALNLALHQVGVMRTIVQNVAVSKLLKLLTELASFYAALR